MKKLIILFIFVASVDGLPQFFNKFWQKKIFHKRSFCSMLDAQHILEPIIKHKEIEQKKIFGSYLGLELLLKKAYFYQSTPSLNLINKANKLLQEIEKDSHLNNAKKRLDATIDHDFKTTFHHDTSQPASTSFTKKERHLNGLQMNCIELCLKEIEHMEHNVQKNS